MNEKLREEWEKYNGQRCEKHIDFFPDECGCDFNWWLKVIADERARLVEEIEKFIDEFGTREHKKIYFQEMNDAWKQGYSVGLQDIINLIKSNETKTHPQSDNNGQ